MLSRHRQIHAGRHWLNSIVVSMALILLATPTLQAAGSEEPPSGWDVIPASPAGAEAITGDDGGDWELGIHGSAGNLTQATAAERYGMSYWLSPMYSSSPLKAKVLVWLPLKQWLAKFL